MNIYLDVCCLNRPFDDQVQDRIRIEAEAILAILFRCKSGEWFLFGSDIIDVEINKIPDSFKKRKVFLLSDIAKHKISLNESIKARGNQLQLNGFSLFDSLHIASAEEIAVDVMLTTDDRLLKKSKQIKDIRVKIENPVIWLMEVTRNEYVN